MLPFQVKKSQRASEHTRKADERLSTQIAELREQYTSLQHMNLEESSRLNFLKNTQSHHEQEIAQLSDQARDNETVANQNQELQKTITTLQEELSSAKDLIDVSDKASKYALQQKSQYEKLLADEESRGKKLSAQVVKLEQEVDELRPKLSEYQIMKTRLTEVDDELSQRKQLHAQALEAHQIYKSEAEAKQENLSDTIYDKQEEIKSLTDSLSESISANRALQDRFILLDDSHQTALKKANDDFDKRINDLAEVHSIKVKACDELSAKLKQDLDQQISQCEEWQKRFQDESSKTNQLEQELQKVIRDMADNNLSNAQRDQRLGALKQEVEHLQDEKAQLQQMAEEHKREQSRILDQHKKESEDLARKLKTSKANLDKVTKSSDGRIEELSRAFQDSQAKIVALQKDLRDSQTKAKKIQQDQSKQSSQKEEAIEKQIHHLQTTITQLENQKSNLSEKIESYVIENSKFTAIISDLQEQLQIASKTCTSSNKELQIHQDEIGQYKQEIQNFEFKLQDREERYRVSEDKLKNQIQGLQQKLGVAEDTIQESEQRLANIGSSNDQQMIQANETIKSLQEKLIRSEEAFDQRLQSRLKDIQVELQITSVELEEEKKTVEQLQQSMDESQQQYQENTTNLKTLLKQSQDAKSTLEKELTQSNTKLKQIQDELATSRSTITQLEENSDSVIAKLQQKIQDKSDQYDQLLSKQSDNEIFQKRIEELQQELIASQSSHSEIEQKLTESKTHIADLEEKLLHEVKQLEEDIQSQSRSKEELAMLKERSSKHQEEFLNAQNELTHSKSMASLLESQLRDKTNEATKLAEEVAELRIELGEIDSRYQSTSNNLDSQLATLTEQNKNLQRQHAEQVTTLKQQLQDQHAKEITDLKTKLLIEHQSNSSKLTEDLTNRQKLFHQQMDADHQSQLADLQQELLKKETDFEESMRKQQQNHEQALAKYDDQIADMTDEHDNLTAKLLSLTQSEDNTRIRLKASERLVESQKDAFERQTALVEKQLHLLATGQPDSVLPPLPDHLSTIFDKINTIKKALHEKSTISQNLQDAQSKLMKFQKDQLNLEQKLSDENKRSKALQDSLKQHKAQNQSLHDQIAHHESSAVGTKTELEIAQNKLSTIPLLEKEIENLRTEHKNLIEEMTEQRHKSMANTQRLMAQLQAQQPSIRTPHTPERRPEQLTASMLATPELPRIPSHEPTPPSPSGSSDGDSEDCLPGWRRYFEKGVPFYHNEEFEKTVWTLKEMMEIHKSLPEPKQNVMKNSVDDLYADSPSHQYMSPGEAHQPVHFIPNYFLKIHFHQMFIFMCSYRNKHNQNA